jgi:hypothetical protein
MLAATVRLGLVPQESAVAEEPEPVILLKALMPQALLEEPEPTMAVVAVVEVRRELLQ